MRVLFDWDDPDLDPLYAVQRGLKLIVYAFCKLLGLKPRYVEEVYTETDRHVKTIAKLNQMLGVETIFGVRDKVSEVKSSSLEYLKDSGCDVRRHVHIGKYGPDRKRLWEPPLNQPPHTWHYDADYIKGKHVELLPGELPIWHIDRPYHLKNYIDFLYNEFYKGG